jgi:hypothetical protein
LPSGFVVASRKIPRKAKKGINPPAQQRTAVCASLTS